MGELITRYSPEWAADWDAFLHTTPDATACHSSAWLAALDRTWRHRSYSVLVLRDMKVRGVLPLVHVKSRLFGSMLVSTPMAIYGGPLATDQSTRAALVCEARRLASSLRVDYLELRHTFTSAAPQDETDFRRQHLYVSFDRTLPPDADELLASFPKKIRYQVRQATSNGLVSEIGGAELLDAFYDVYAANMRRLGTPVYPKRFFAELLRTFAHSAEVLLVRDGRRVAGATFNLYFRDTVLPHYGCAHAELHHRGTTAFMYFEVMRRAAARGYTRFDFGRSKIGSGSCSFKRGWRMHERALPYAVLLVRGHRMPNLNPTNPRFKLAIQLWRRLPLGVTRVVGPRLVGNIP